MSRAIVLVVLLATSVAACANGGPAPLRGHYYWGHEVETFHPCGSKQAFWVVGDPSLLQPLRDKADELSQAKGQPYQPIYVEVSGDPEGKANDGFAADYAGVYRITSVHDAKSSSPAGCKAHG